MTAREEITARLLQGGVAGPHRSHAKEDNVLKASQLASGEPDSTFGMPDLASATTEEGLEAVLAVTGAREPGEAYIDPDATIAGVQAASARLGKACRNGARIVVASGHPGPLLNHHARLVVIPADVVIAHTGAAARIPRHLLHAGDEIGNLFMHRAEDPGCFHAFGSSVRQVP